MASKFSVDFKVIIVGGSVAGLTLAHALDSAHIDYIILEARNSIAPPLGATIVIHPNGARILDQMGIYEPLRKIMIPLNQVFSRRADGRIISCTEWTPIIQDRLGYTPAIFERQKFLQSMYEQLKDKSKVHLNKRVTVVKNRTDSILVRCEDGTEYIGDVVVGADGIHSKVRREMQRHAEETGPPGLVDNDKNCITSEYNCFFGVSEPIPELREGNLHTVYDIDQSGLLFVGNRSLPQWFFITKMDKKYQGDEIPRFTKADMENQVLQRGDFQFTAGLTLKRLMATTKTLSYLALEEAIHEVWTYDRIVCLGDSIHKMTPNLGQGGNQTIEGVAVLINCLLKMLDRPPGHDLTTADIEQTLHKKIPVDATEESK